VRLAEPFAENAISETRLRRRWSRRCGVDGAGKNDGTYDNNKDVKDNARDGKDRRDHSKPPIRFSRKPWRTSSGMIMTAKKETSEVNTRL